MVVFVSLVGLLGVSVVAMAEHEESHPEDTWFSFGYDPLDHFLAVNISSNDVDDCALEGETAGTYGEPSEDGIYPLELRDPYDMCAVEGVVVAGPNGQINHGQFMKAAKSLLDMKGQGCLVRYLAKSDIGKTDGTKVSVSDVGPVEIGDGGQFDFSSFEADCNRGNKDERPEKAKKSRPDSPGKSADAPGKNK